MSVMLRCSTTSKAGSPGKHQRLAGANITVPSDQTSAIGIAEAGATKSRPELHSGRLIFILMLYTRKI
jgi:hypothetical protein